VVEHIYRLERLGYAKGFWDHVWLGVTVENQKRADKRISKLLTIPAAHRFVSVEPMLGPVDLKWIEITCDDTAVDFGMTADRPPRIDWVICGGETGLGARPMDPDWARDLRDQCREAGVPFFMKRMSGGTEPPPDLMVRQWPDAKSKNEN